MAEQGTRVGDFKPETAVEADLWLTSAVVKEARNGKPFWDGVFQDSTGSVNAKAWEDSPGRIRGLAELLEPGRPYRVAGRVDTFKDQIQLTVKSARPLAEDEVDPALFSPSAARSPGEMAAEFDAVLESLEDGDLRDLLSRFRRDEAAFHRFCKAPAAKSIHHARVGGLLEHTLALFRLVGAVAPLYPGLNLDLLRAGCVFHDAGKMEEISSMPGFEYTTEGKLLGHIYLGARLAERFLAEVPEFPEEKGRQLLHLILSHQGDRDQGFGSPVDPLSPEAILFHHLDNLDAKMQNCLDQMVRVKEPPAEVPFTDPRSNFPIRKGYYRVRLETGGEGSGDDAGGPAGEEDGAEEGPQRRLW